MKHLSEITHPELVAALVKPGQDILESLTPLKCHLWHMASCLPGEAAELVESLSPYILGEVNSPDRENLLEELGDVVFYFEGLWQGLDMLPPPYAPDRESHRKHISELTLNLVITAGQVFDVIKKFVIYNKPFDHAGTTNALHRFGQSAANMRGFANFTQDEVTKANISKLSKRYVGLTYSDQSAQERLDKAVEQATVIKQDLERSPINPPPAEEPPDPAIFGLPNP